MSPESTEVSNLPAKPCVTLSHQNGTIPPLQKECAKITTYIKIKKVACSLARETKKETYCLHHKF